MIGINSFRRALLASLLPVTLAACAAEAPPAQPEEVEVLVTTVAASPLMVVEELPGRVVAWRVAEIRPQVTGIVQSQLFQQGALVRAGQPLFQINAAPYRAEADTAGAALARASAAYAQARAQAERLRPLAAADAISQQSYDDAVAVRNQAAATVDEARAALRRRQLDVGFSRVTAPISGRIGEATVTQGALVTAGDVNPLATIQQIDRVYVDIRQPVERYAALRASNNADGPVEIVTSSGLVHPIKGRILFSGTAVDASTGEVLVRVAVDNPDELLLPGMYVRARLPRASLPNALTVPQQAVTRDAEGNAQVSIVDQNDRVRVRRVVPGAIVDGRYVIQSGLTSGERVIVEGQDRVQPNTPVKTLPWRKS